MKRLIAFILLLLSSGCSVTIVYAPKSMDAKNSLLFGPTISGSDLKDNNMEQKPEGTVTGIPGA